MACIAGIDGCSAGWVCLLKDLSTGLLDSRIIPNIDLLSSLQPRPDVVMIDVPIGLPDSGQRECDRLAREKLGRPRGSSVFSAPIRNMLQATNYLQACQFGLAADGRKLSRQSWNIVPKIAQVDAFLRSNPSLQACIHEVHPELSFWAWNGNQAMTHGKKTREGKLEREKLVKSLYSKAYAAAQAALPKGKYVNDDLLDAFAALWTAERFLAGHHLTLPEQPRVDTTGLRMAIIA